MKHELFIELLGKLADWCNKRLNEVQKDIYWDQIHKIPDLAFEDIIDQLVQNTPPSGKLPTPDDISIHWFHWLQAHPAFKQTEYPHTYCAECEGEGCFSVWYEAVILPTDQISSMSQDDLDRYKSWCRKFLPCSQCQNWRRVFPTKGPGRPVVFYTKQVILDRGWRLTDPYMERFLTNKGKFDGVKNLGVLGEQVFDDMPALDEDTETQNEIPF